MVPELLSGFYGTKLMRCVVLTPFTVVAVVLAASGAATPGPQKKPAPTKEQKEYEGFFDDRVRG